MPQCAWHGAFSDLAWAKDIFPFSLPTWGGGVCGDACSRQAAHVVPQQWQLWAVGSNQAPWRCCRERAQAQKAWTSPGLSFQMRHLAPRLVKGLCSLAVTERWRDSSPSLSDSAVLFTSISSPSSVNHPILTWVAVGELWVSAMTLLSLAVVE